MWKWTWLLVLTACLGDAAKETPDGDDSEDDTDSVPVPDTDSVPTDTDEPDTDSPDTDVSDTDPPETDLPDTDLPDTDLVETDPPDTDPPDTDLPDTDPPDTDTAVDLCAQAAIYAGVPGPPVSRLQGGETLMVEAGPQGGFHIWFAAELYVIDGPTTITTTLDLTNGTRIANFSTRRMITPQAGCLTTVDDLRAVLDYLAVGLTLRDLDGQVAHVEITATQGARSLTDGADIIIDVP